MAERVLVVGAGAISEAWFPALLEERVHIGAVVDLRIEAARAAIHKYKLDAEAATELAAALKKVKPDFVLDLTVPEAHCDVTCAALEAGCHVLGEKPMAASMEEARRMVATAERTRKVYMVSQNRRWEPRHEAIRGALASEVIGGVSTINCDFYVGAHFGGFRDEMAHPLLLDMAIHHFDLARLFSGSDGVAVYAKEFNPKGSWYRGDVAASCVFEMTDGIVFTYRGSWCAEGFPTSWHGNWRIVGERGTVLYEQDQDPRAQVVAGEAGFQRPVADVPIPVAAMEATGMHGALREMLAFLRTGRRPQTECHDNVKSFAMVHAAVESARRTQRLTLEVS